MESATIAAAALAKAQPRQLPELDLSEFLLAPELGHRDGIVEMLGRRMPRGATGVALSLAVIGLGSFERSRPHDTTWTVGLCAALASGAVLLALLLSMLERMTVELDQAGRTIRVERRWPGLRPRRQTIAFEAVSSVEIAAVGAAPHCLVLNSASGSRALLGRFRSSEGLVDTARDLNILLFGEEEMVRRKKLVEALA